MSAFWVVLRPLQSGPRVEVEWDSAQRPPAGQHGRGLGLVRRLFQSKDWGPGWESWGSLWLPPALHTLLLDERLSCSQLWAHPSSPGASGLQAPQ